MSCPIIEYRLCQKGRELYRTVCKISKSDSPLLKKIELYDDEYEMLLKGIPLHKRNDYLSSIPINGKLITRRKEG